MIDSDTPNNGTAISIHYMDLLAALRIAALQAHDDRMPICAARHEAQAADLEAAYQNFRALYPDASMTVTIRLEVTR